MKSGRPLTRFLHSFSHAFRGIRSFLITEQNGRIHLAISFLVILAGWYYEINHTEWIIITLCIGMVISAELINTAIEKLCDHNEPDWHQNIKRIKDLAAGGVLVISVAAAVAGLLIFIPRIADFYQL